MHNMITQSVSFVGHCKRSRVVGKDAEDKEFEEN